MGSVPNLYLNRCKGSGCGRVLSEEEAKFFAPLDDRGKRWGYICSECQQRRVDDDE